MNIDGFEVPCALPEALSLEDQWILSRFNTVAKEVTENLDKFELGVAVSKLYDFLWDDFCDWYIELAKRPLNGEDKAAAQNTPARCSAGCSPAPWPCCTPLCPSSPRRSGRVCPTRGRP